MNEKIYAVYSPEGYTVYSARYNQDEDEELACCGNHAKESTAIVDPDSPNALPLKTIKKYAESTAQQFADERGADYAGVELKDDSGFFSEGANNSGVAK